MEPWVASVEGRTCTGAVIGKGIGAGAERKKGSVGVGLCAAGGLVVKVTLVLRELEVSKGRRFGLS